MYLLARHVYDETHCREGNNNRDNDEDKRNRKTKLLGTRDDGVQSIYDNFILMIVNLVDDGESAF